MLFTAQLIYGDPARATESYVGAAYIQHNSLVGDGKAAFSAYVGKMARGYPEKDIKFVRAVAEGNLVALHTHQTWPEEDYVTMDFFRYDDDEKSRAVGRGTSSTE